MVSSCVFFFFQAEDGIRDYKVTGVQTCALPICAGRPFLGVPGLGCASFKRFWLLLELAGVESLEQQLLSAVLVTVGAKAGLGALLGVQATGFGPLVVYRAAP